jgi:hypothetical protein
MWLKSSSRALSLSFSFGTILSSSYAVTSVPRAARPANEAD